MSRCPSFPEPTELGVCSTGLRCCPKSLEQKYFWSATVQGGSLDPQQLFNCLFAVFMKWQQNLLCVTWGTTAHLSTAPFSPRSWDARGILPGMDLLKSQGTVSFSSSSCFSRLPAKVPNIKQLVPSPTPFRVFFHPWWKHLQEKHPEHLSMPSCTPASGDAPREPTLMPLATLWNQSLFCPALFCPFPWADLVRTRSVTLLSWQPRGNGPISCTSPGLQKVVGGKCRHFAYFVDCFLTHCTVLGNPASTFGCLHPAHV